VSVVYLVRHGQAMLRGDNYDQLSETGERQAGLAGAALAERGVQPTRVVRGSLERHRQTATQALDAAGWDSAVEVDDSWNELDYIDVIAAQRPTYTSHAVMMADLGQGPDPEEAFRLLYDVALRSWLADDGSDHSYAEPYAVFAARIAAALGAVTDGLAEGETAVIFTSGGPISSVSALALGLDAKAWFALSRFTINAGITKVVSGRSGLSLVSFNDHAHLEAQGVMTYR
jgi:broad specificity phosphatase PhoE